MKCHSCCLIGVRLHLLVPSHPTSAIHFALTSIESFLRRLSNSAMIYILLLAASPLKSPVRVPLARLCSRLSACAIKPAPHIYASRSAQRGASQGFRTSGLDPTPKSDSTPHQTLSTHSQPDIDLPPRKLYPNFPYSKQTSSSLF
jgi:hypothetical protein